MKHQLPEKLTYSERETVIVYRDRDHIKGFNQLIDYLKEREEEGQICHAKASQQKKFDAQMNGMSFAPVVEKDSEASYCQGFKDGSYTLSVAKEMIANLPPTLIR